ncbi:uncharacterized protein [Rutidosis leptorrhynchoides]|uniref:uncharacterized protein n=1 Tax=Rutidosis leptorrhynchoides TaxID=125765 RepID=UPI003A9A14DA
MTNNSGKVREFFWCNPTYLHFFAKSTKRWKILKDNVIELTLKPLSSICWDSCIDSVKAMRLQMVDKREVLLEESDSDNDSLIRSEVKSLANNELGDFEFMVVIVIWYDLLHAINLVSKKLQLKYMLVCDAIENVKDSNAIEAVKGLAMEMEIDPIFSQRHKIKRKIQFDETLDDESARYLAEYFRVNYFNCIIDQAIVSIDMRIFLIIPLTVATAERSFSKLKLLKSYLHNSMSQERLYELALVAIENEILNKLALENLIDEFVSKNARRKKIFN